MQSEDTRNLVLAIAIVLAMMIGYELLFAKQVAPQPDARTQQNIEAGTGQPAQPGAAPAPGTAATPGTPDLSVREDRATALSSAPRIAIKTPRLSGSLRLKGGRIDDLTLLGYRQTVEKDSPDVVLLSPGRTEHPYFVDFLWLDAAGRPGTALPSPETEWQTTATTLSPGKPAVLTWDNGQGLLFTRTYSIDEHYLITVDEAVENTTGEPVSLKHYALVDRVGIPESAHSALIHEGPMGVLAKDTGDSSRDLKNDITYKSLKEDALDENRTSSQTSYGGTTGGWLGIADKYWLVALVPDNAAPFTGTFAYSLVNGRDVYRSAADSAARTVPAGGKIATKTRVFAGAKESRLLEAYENEQGITLFDRAIDWGWMPFLAKPVFWLLEWLKTFLGNFGLAILAITVLIKLAFFTLANKSYIAMGKMRKLTPKITALRERYKDDPTKQREEMMKLYQTEKVNPVAGCLPILVQIPVFIALYQVLMASIEMRHAPFYGWVKDMSAHDPLLVTNLFGLIPWTPPSFLAIGIWTLIMGATMYIQQQLNPPPPDPIQAKVFQFLPLLFIFMFASFPVGLVIYWTWNNILTIAQQWVIMKRHGAFND
ncbi:membrane protein insertase YidC [Iodidimonas sp. SYSU 1G8]|uniref:membrane protein insertase YidC n=1 Tax=Iodidimonas sp. SYSU 1G8 TaxID=3133967 RepID=UPI0031FED77C